MFTFLFCELSKKGQVLKTFVLGNIVWRIIETSFWRVSSRCSMMFNDFRGTQSSFFRALWELFPGFRMLSGTMKRECRCFWCILSVFCVRRSIKMDDVQLRRTPSTPYFQLNLTAIITIPAFGWQTLWWPVLLQLDSARVSLLESTECYNLYKPSFPVENTIRLISSNLDAF